MNAKRTIVQLSVLGCCAVAVSVAHAAGGSIGAQRPASAAPHDAGTRSATGTAVNTPANTAAGAGARTSARSHLRILRTPRDARRDTVPAHLRRSGLLAGGDVDLGEARAVAASGGERAWIAPSSDGTSVCAVRAGAIACPPAALLEVTGLSPGINGRLGDPFHVWGIAGDDVSSIVLVEADGTRVPVTATDNFFDVETEEWPRSLTWTGPSGPESFTFPPYS
ncbi:hypothetical protein [Conexibacter sp. CPCC 206217]|uniref:hypothetical protein n=1 Tax=Conexibacter sp. CPCC 206217 TaxID=3064574 RepID=UPI00271640EF|nr:hypothetical protein [Conexibacter sp. CPCC 206217]MDO8214098.1 hypothetical protein [Conexibacter sp. CPCC 206217]